MLLGKSIVEWTDKTVKAVNYLVPYHLENESFGLRLIYKIFYALSV